MDHDQNPRKIIDNPGRRLVMHAQMCRTISARILEMDRGLGQQEKRGACNAIDVIQVGKKPDRKEIAMIRLAASAMARQGLRSNSEGFGK